MKRTVKVASSSFGLMYETDFGAIYQVNGNVHVRYSRRLTTPQQYVIYMIGSDRLLYYRRKFGLFNGKQRISHLFHHSN